MQERAYPMTTDAEKTGDSPPERPLEKRSLFGWVTGLFRSTPTGELAELSATAEDLRGGIRIGQAVKRFKLKLGQVPLEFHLDLPISGEVTGSNLGWVVFRRPNDRTGITESLRIEPGETVVFGRTDAIQTRLFEFDRSVSDRHVKVSNAKGLLSLEVLDPERTTRIAELSPDASLWAQRRANLERLSELLGRPLVPFGEEEALIAIQEINTILSVEAYREPNDDGHPGGIIMIPDDMTAVVMGDLHARANNLLRVITEGDVLSAMEKGEVCLVLLGDLMHSELDDELEDMDSSIFILDLFCMLKRRFPESIFYLHGNHESFGAEVAKGGVPQGVLLRKHLKKLRGTDYVREVQKMFDSLAFIAQGNNFACCHGAPVRSKVSREALVNIHHYPGLQSEIVWNRPRGPNRPSGYGKGSLKRFRQTLMLPKEATVLVGHTPQNSTETLWMDINGLTGNHIVYSAHADRLAVMVMRDGHATPLQYIPDPAMEFLNGQNAVADPPAPDADEGEAEETDSA